MKGISVSGNIAEEQRNADLAAIQRDELSAPCECCQEVSGNAWFDQQWLCDKCRAMYGAALDNEQPQRISPRRKYFGGSDAGVLAGVDPYRDLFALVMEKRGQLDPEPPNMRQALGTCMEGGVLDAYQLLTGRSVQRNHKTSIHPTIPHFGATPDALCLSELRGIDAKISSPDQFAAWLAGPPQHYILQCQWYMRFYAYPVWDIARWDGGDLKVYSVEADPAIQEALLSIAGAVWARYVVGGEMPLIGSSPASGRFLKQHYPRNTAPLRRATAEEEALLDQYADVRRTHEEIQDQRSSIEARLKLAVADSDGLYSPRARFTWKSSRDTSDYAWEELALKLLQQLPETQRTALLAEHCRQRSGSRRIHFVNKGAQSHGK